MHLVSIKKIQKGLLDPRLESMTHFYEISGMQNGQHWGDQVRDSSKWCAKWCTMYILQSAMNISVNASPEGFGGKTEDIRVQKHSLQNFFLFRSFSSRPSFFEFLKCGTAIMISSGNTIWQYNTHCQSIWLYVEAIAICSLLKWRGLQGQIMFKTFVKDSHWKWLV